MSEDERRPTPATPTASRVVDLMAALEESVRAAKDARVRHDAAKAARCPEPEEPQT